MNAHIANVKIHLPLPDVLFRVTHSRQPGPPAMVRNVLSATTRVHNAEPRSPEFRAIACKLQYLPGPMELIASQRLARRLPKLCKRSTNQFPLSLRWNTSDKKVYKPEITLRIDVLASRLEWTFLRCAMVDPGMIRKYCQKRRGRQHGHCAATLKNLEVCYLNE